MPTTRGPRERLGTALHGRYHCNAAGVAGDVRWQVDKPTCLLDVIVQSETTTLLRAFGLVIVTRGSQGHLDRLLQLSLRVMVGEEVYVDAPMPLLLLGARALDLPPGQWSDEAGNVIYGAWKPMLDLSLQLHDRLRLLVAAPFDVATSLRGCETEPPSADWLFDVTAYAEGLETRHRP